jgi:hypothetical protein
MTTASVSFRITRHTEDLAQTIHALSQRVVQLEQRLAVLEEQVAPREEELPAEQLTSLANVDQLLRDCRELLAADPLKGSTAFLDAPAASGNDPAITEDPLEEFAVLDEAA